MKRRFSKHRSSIILLTSFALAIAVCLPMFLFVNDLTEAVLVYLLAVAIGGLGSRLAYPAPDLTKQVARELSITEVDLD